MYNVFANSRVLARSDNHFLFPQILHSGPHYCASLCDFFQVDLFAFVIQKSNLIFFLSLFLCLSRSLQNLHNSHESEERVRIISREESNYPPLLRETLARGTKNRNNKKNVRPEPDIPLSPASFSHRNSMTRQRTRHSTVTAAQDAATRDFPLRFI